MFFVPDKSKLNNFKLVHVSRGCDLFSRFGNLESVPSSSDGQIIPINMNKLDSLEFLDNYDRMMSERENVSEVQEENFTQNEPPAD